MPGYPLKEECHLQTVLDMMVKNLKIKKPQKRSVCFELKQEILPF